jgi:hypothetical protein
VISAHPHVPAAEGLVLFGFNVLLAGFADAFAMAKKSQRRVFLNVLIHSQQMMAAPEEKSLLAKALAQVAADEECATLTLAQAASSFRDELAVVNQAASNIVPFRDATGSVRARSWIYFRGLPPVRRSSRIVELQRQAQSEFLQGNYQACDTFGSTIDRRCRTVLWLGRAAILAASGLLAYALRLALASPLAFWFLLCFPILASMLLLGWTQRTEIRREVLVCMTLFALGAAGGLCLFKMSSGPVRVPELSARAR